MNSNIHAICIEKINTSLCSENTKIKKDCLDNIYENISIRAYKPENSELNDFLKLLIKCLNDKSEVCREKAILIITQCIYLWDLSFEDVTPIIPIIQKEFLLKNVNETSEEVRLSLIKLLRIMINKFNYNLSHYIEELTNIIIKCILDTFPEIKKEGCECATALALHYPNLFIDYSEKIIKAIINILKYKHYKIRVAAIISLNDLVLYGQKGSLKVVCSSLGECLLDQNPHVRVAILRTVGFWFMKHTDRYSYSHFMLPLILTMLCDENFECRREANELWDKIGVQYMKENEENLKDKINFLPKILENYPSNFIRPNLGCRAIVLNDMMKIIPALLKELADWKTDVRIKASELIKIIILHAETKIIQSIESMLLAMYKACTDEESVVVTNIVQSAEIMGYFVSPDIYWSIISTHIKNNCCLGHYIIIASLLKFSDETVILPKVEEIISVLVDDNIRETREKHSQKCLLDIVKKLMECKKKFEHIILYKFYLILLSVMSLGDEDIQNQVDCLLINFSNNIGLTSTSELNMKYFSDLFNQLDEKCIAWDTHSCDFNIFKTLIIKFTDNVFEFVPEMFLKISQIILSSDSDRNVTFEILLTIAQVLENRSLVIKNHPVVMEKFITEPLKQQLIWKAGKIAEVIRGTAMAIVLLYLKNTEEIPNSFIAEILPVILGLCEDSYEETRIFSLKAVGQISEHKIIVRLEPKYIIKCLTNRLNDKSDAVRLTALSSVGKLLNVIHLDTYKDHSDFSDVHKSLEMIVICSDDGNMKIRDAVLDLFVNTEFIRNMKSVLSEEKLTKLIDNCTDKKVSRLLKTRLKI